MAQVVAKAVDDTVADYSLLSEEVPDKVASTLKSRLAEYLQARLATLDDSVVGDLEEELQRLRVRNEELESTGFAKIKQDRDWKENLICLLLYVYNEGEPLELRKDRIKEMEEVDFRFEDDDEYIRVFTVEQEES